MVSQISNCHFYYCLYGRPVKGGSVDWSVQWSVDQVRGGSMDWGSVFSGHPSYNISVTQQRFSLVNLGYLW